ncbi:MAG: histidine kinase [Candidatus Nanopelagicales bacterium]|nr:histidine kinase [Candidatus Nanopelagicales bacterium]MDZ7578965.1 histidine kinase [Candidatus Nanopelagicales bacterium]
MGQIRFWIVQASVALLAAAHDFGLEPSLVFGLPAPFTSWLLLIPVVYAAVTFGLRGAVATSLWGTLLVVAHWPFPMDQTPAHVWIELRFVLILNVVAIIVGQRVESEQQARLRAEAAARSVRIAKARYHSLFDGQPSPVIITDVTGVVSEVNAAAVTLFGRDPAGQPSAELLGDEAADVLGGAPHRLMLHDGQGQDRLFVPTARELATDDGTYLVQVVLTDVTEEHRRHEEQRYFASQLLAVQEEERRRLARELHDDPLQNVMFLTRALDDLSHESEIPEAVAQRLNVIGGVADDAATALRKLIHGLRPSVLDDLGLVSALRQLVNEARNRSRLVVDFTATGPEARLPAQVELAAYRIAQESLNNVIRHADATRATVRLRFGEQLTLTITDDGSGIPPSKSPGDPVPGLGLIGMRERVNMTGGTLTVGRVSPHGTRVRARLPCVHPGNQQRAGVRLRRRASST